nr:immunoglobulin light chain junction region [Macaca mulatta]MOW60032.1 immunoglobulin light chain junction region [Macaca mulatta]
DYYCSSYAGRKTYIF